MQSLPHTARNQQPEQGLILPVVPSWAEPVWHLFVIRHPQRDQLQKRLTEAGIGTLIHYPVPPHQSGAYCAARDSKLRAVQQPNGGTSDPLDPSSREFSSHGYGPLPLADQLANTVLSLPIGPHLNEQQAEYVIRAVDLACESLSTQTPSLSPV